MNKKQINSILDILAKSNIAVSLQELQRDLNRKQYFWNKWSKNGLFKFLEKLEAKNLVVKQVVTTMVTASPFRMTNVVVTDPFRIRKRYVKANQYFYSIGKFPQMLGRKVTFEYDGKTLNGEVVFQDYHKLFINHLNAKNEITQTIRYLSEVGHYCCEPPTEETWYVD